MLNLDDLTEEAKRFTWRGREFAIPDTQDYSCDQVKEIRLLQKQFLAAEDDIEKQLEIMKRQMKFYVPGFTDEDVNAISQRQITALMKLLQPETTTPTEAEIKPEAISAAN